MRIPAAHRRASGQGPGVEPGSVVVGVDGTPYSDAAVAWAASYAVARHAPLCVLHGAGDLGGDQVPFRTDAREMLAEVSRGVTDRALALVARQAPGLEPTVLAPFDDPRRALLDLEDVSMVVLGTRGRGMVAALLLGSVSLAVTSQARWPVTVVRPLVDDADASGPVVVGVDVDGSAQEALDLAFEIASMTHRPLVALHASPLPEPRTEHERAFAETLAGFPEKYPDVPLGRRLVEDTGPVHALVAASEHASHVVVGSRETRRLTRHFGSVSRSVVEHAHCPVTVVRP